MIRVGIFFGGASREREISFAGGRTVYDNLNKALFDAVPVFVDALGNFILLDWALIYKGTTRDFYPPTAALQYANAPYADANQFQLYPESLGVLNSTQVEDMASEVGTILQPSAFAALFDIAFLCLHGPYGEDGNIQGLLEWYKIPYTGSGVYPSAIGINKMLQHTIMQQYGFKRPANMLISRQEWLTAPSKQLYYQDAILQLGAALVVKAPTQGSSIGVSVMRKANLEQFIEAVDKSFFIAYLSAEDWQKYSQEEKYKYLRTLTDIREGIGMPLWATPTNGADASAVYFTHPSALLAYLDAILIGTAKVRLESHDTESTIMVESFISGREFSCIVVEDELGRVIALPPTEIIKGNDIYDYRSKYLPGLSRKVTPINLPAAQVNAIKNSCKDLFRKLGFDVYARIDGFYTDKEEIFLNDPNTTSGMLPSSFFFHQAAEIGLNPSQFLTFIIAQSLIARQRTGKGMHHLKALSNKLNQSLSDLNANVTTKRKVGIIMGGFSSERHISIESGRNIYEKLASSEKYQPIPVFLTGSEKKHELYLIPINVMLKDNADDIKEKVTTKYKANVVLDAIRDEATSITLKYASGPIARPEEITYKHLSEIVEEVFIALHGRPGEDGSVQKWLDKYHVPYNGSGVVSSATTINKFETNEILAKNGFLVATHKLIQKADYLKDPEALYKATELLFPYPFIAKPSDDGCSSAVKKIKNREQFAAFCDLIFRKAEGLLDGPAATLQLSYAEEFPQKDYFMVETLIAANGASNFLEITGGMLTSYNANNEKEYLVFEPSEALATGEVLSLEEKFLAGEGQNITPARYSPNAVLQANISAQVKDVLKRVAQTLNVEGYCRIDAFVRIYEDNRVETIIIEINSLPGMTPATCIFHQAAIADLKPYQFIASILDFGVKRLLLQQQAN